MPSRLLRSLSVRLLAIYLVMGALFVYGSLLGIRWVYDSDQLRELVSGHLSLHVDYVRKDIGNPPRIANAIEITRKVPIDIRIVGPGMDWSSDPEFPAPSKLEFGDSDVFQPATAQWLRGIEGIQFAEYRGHGFLKFDQGPYVVIVASPRISEEVVERNLTPVIVGFGLVLVLLTYLAVRWLFRPIGAIRRGAAQIGQGHFEHRITAVRDDQLGDLAADINRMAEDVQRMLDAKRQLLLGISHELRSPLSRLKLALELADDSPENSGLRDDVVEMEKIIVTLLEAERLNTRHAALRITRVSVRQLVDQLIDDYFSGERDRIQVNGPDGLGVQVDEARVTLMLKNLVSNALRYGPAGNGTIAIDFDRRGDKWWISVSDRGPGIPPDQVDRIGEPFHRGDPSRTRDTGGSGLGLYLARLVARAHAGTLELDLAYTGGARFVVTLPLSPAEDAGAVAPVG
ncbi:MAG: HAMP domain-containing histidine kinase [Steroidobacteraceae bacterium]|nr:HAMP domain-containing histidine kinase [Steroidobacteraceae bacterium]